MSHEIHHRLARLYLDAPLQAETPQPLGADARHYLVDVLRLAAGDRLRLFNARDGEWLAEITALSRRGVELQPVRRLRGPEEDPVADVWLVFAPLKRAANEWLLEKATELGATRIIPVVTERSQTRRINAGRWRAIAREAAEQCERLSVPGIADLVALADLLAAWPAERTLFVARERTRLPHLARCVGDTAGHPAALLVGPEGGLSERDMALLESCPAVRAVSLGPRILRAETAAVFGLSLMVAQGEAGG